MEQIAITDEQMSFLTRSLQRMDFFRSLSVADLDDILRYVRQYSYKKGEFLFKMGDPGDALYIIGDGKAKVFVKPSFFTSKTLGFLNPGDMCGEMALVDGRRRSASVKTLIPTNAFVLLRSSFDSILESNPTFSEKVKKIIEQRKVENKQA